MTMEWKIDFYSTKYDDATRPSAEPEAGDTYLVPTFGADGREWGSFRRRAAEQGCDTACSEWGEAVEIDGETWDRWTLCTEED